MYQIEIPAIAVICVKINMLQFPLEGKKEALMGAWTYINKTEREGGWARERERGERERGERKKRASEREGKRERHIVIEEESKGGVKRAVVEKRRKKKSTRKREEEKKFNLLKILQIAPVYNSSKLLANQSRVPITLPFNLDTMVVDVSVSVETRDEAHRWQASGKARSDRGTGKRGEEVNVLFSQQFKLPSHQAEKGTPKWLWWQEKLSFWVSTCRHRTRRRNQQLEGGRA